MELGSLTPSPWPTRPRSRNASQPSSPPARWRTRESGSLGVIMSAAKQLTGMRGVYLVAAELSRLGFIASPTSRSAIGADLLVTDQQCQNAFTVQVKTNASTFSF